MLIKNVSDGPRGVWADGLVVMLAPGESADLSIAAADLKAAKASDWFEFGKAEASEEDDKDEPDADLAKLNDDELRAFLTERGVDMDGRWKRARLLTEAAKVKDKA